MLIQHSQALDSLSSTTNNSWARCFNFQPLMSWWFEDQQRMSRGFLTFLNIKHQSHLISLSLREITHFQSFAYSHSGKLAMIIVVACTVKTVFEKARVLAFERWRIGHPIRDCFPRSWSVGETASSWCRSYLSLSRSCHSGGTIPKGKCWWII